MSYGNIPENVTMFWSDNTDGKAYVSDSTNEATISTGIEWARPYRGDDLICSSEMANKPMSGVRIESLEIRGKGGRAYKVIIPTGHLVDLREDQLMFAIMSHGIKPNGILGGEYLFCRVGSQMKLILVGGKFYNDMVASTKQLGKKKIGARALVVGHIYKSRTETRLYLGRYSGFKYPSYSKKEDYVTNGFLWLKRHDFYNPKTIHDGWKREFWCLELSKGAGSMIECFGAAQFDISHEEIVRWIDVAEVEAIEKTSVSLQRAVDNGYHSVSYYTGELESTIRNRKRYRETFIKK
jgi:hypothetical protein